MPRQSRAERTFRTMYPHANTRPGPTGLIQVFAGDYLCEEGRTAAIAYSRALDAVGCGNITPDPSEQRGEFPEAVTR